MDKMIELHTPTRVLLTSRHKVDRRGSTDIIARVLLLGKGDNRFWFLRTPGDGGVGFLPRKIRD
jgi:hypothetical protein